MVRALLVLVGLFLLWFLRELVLVVLTSIVIASFMESSVHYFKKIGIGRVPGIVIVYIISIVTLTGMFYLFAPLLITEIYNFSTLISDYIPNVSFLNYFQNEAFSGAKDIVGSLSGNLSITSLFSVSKAFIMNLSGGFIQTLSVAFGSIFNVLLIVVISFYLSAQEKGIDNFLRIILPPKYENYVVDLWQRSSLKIGLWVKGQLVLGLIDAVLIYLVLSLIGVEYALLFAIVAGFMGLIPYGTLIALVPVVSVSYLSGGWGDAFMVAGAYLIIHEFEVFLFAPLLIKSIVGLSPIVIILSILMGFELGGIWGAILCIPIAVVVMEFLSDIEKDKNLLKTQNK
jgi:predicted PurR-regulated permease PerM